MKLFTTILCAVALLFVHAFAIAADEASKDEFSRDKNPAEVDMLIGKRFESSRISGWEAQKGGLLGVSPQPQRELGIVELRRNAISIFAVELIDQRDMSVTVLDAQVLPQQAQFDKRGLLILSEKNSRLYNFDYACENPSDEKVVAMIRPEHGKEYCEHLSKQIQRAWKIDKTTGHVTEISPQGISCYWIAPN